MLLIGLSSSLRLAITCVQFEVNSIIINACARKIMDILYGVVTELSARRSAKIVPLRIQTVYTRIGSAVYIPRYPLSRKPSFVSAGTVLPSRFPCVMVPAAGL